MKKINDYLFYICIITIFSVETVSAGCLLGDDLMREIDSIFTTICWIGLALCFILGMIDFIKGISGGKDGDLKANSAKFVKRLIACVILLILPEVVEWIIKLVDSNWAGCQIKS